MMRSRESLNSAHPRCDLFLKSSATWSRCRPTKTRRWSITGKPWWTTIARLGMTLKKNNITIEKTVATVASR